MADIDIQVFEQKAVVIEVRRGPIGPQGIQGFPGDAPLDALSPYAVGDMFYAGAPTIVAKLATVATNYALISGGVGAPPTWGKVGLTTHVDGVLPVSNGGTGQNALNLVDHGAFGGLTDDDHSLYPRVDGTRGFSGVVSGITPTLPAHLATKAYVDGAVVGLEWQDSVKDQHLTAPPGSPITGYRYIVASVATGAWATHEKAIAQYNGATWDFITPSEGMAVWVDDEDCIYVYSETAWAKMGTFLDHGNLTGLADDDHTQYILHSLATAASDFLVASGAGAYVKKTLSETKAILELPASPYVIGDMFYASSISVQTKLAAVAVNNALISGGIGAPPAWGKVPLAAIADMATGALLGRNTALAGIPEVITDIPTAITIGGAYVYRAGGTDVAAADGGTGQSAYAGGDLLYADSTTTLAKLADVAVGSYLASGGIGVAPAWATLNQAAVAGLTTADGPSFAHLHLADLAAIYTAAESWIGPSSTAGIYFKGGWVGIGTTPSYPLHISRSDMPGYPTAPDYTAVFSNAGGNREIAIGLDTTGEPTIQARIASTLAARQLSINPLGGNVGIGTTTPGFMLDVAGTLSALKYVSITGDGTAAYGLILNATDQSYARIRINNTGSGGNAWSAMVGNPGVSNAGFAIRNETADLTTLYIDSTGNVGIGTTTPQSRLHIYNNEDNQVPGASTGGLEISNEYSGAYGRLAEINFATGYANNATYRYASIAGAYTSYGTGYYGGDLVFSTRLGGDANLTERMRIDHHGNVGVGTTTPDGYKLNVNGAGYFFGDESAVSIYLYAGRAIRNTGGTYVDTGTGGSGDLSFRMGSAYTDTMIVTNSGRVGIGTTSPGEKLDVNGQVRIDRVGYASTLLIGDTTNANKTYAQLETSADTGGYFRVQVVKQTGAYGDIVLNEVGGNVGIGTAVPTNLLSLGGNAARIFWMERHTTAENAGNSLTVQAGGATVAGTNKAGGQLILLPGLSTGSAESGVTIRGCVAGGAGTGDNSLQDMIKVLGNKLGVFNVTPAVQQNHIADASGGATVDAEARAAINAALLVLETYGFLKAA